MKTTLLSFAALLVALLFLVGSWGTVASGEEGDDDMYKNTFIEKESGTTDYFGGGNFVAIKFGTDAWFSVIYGSEDNPNSIVITSIAARYLGAAEVYNGEGEQLYQQIPIKMYSTFAMKFYSLIEFNDTDDDGLFDYQRKGDGLEKKDFIKANRETIYKAVDLKTAWERSEVKATSNDTSRSWSFTLTAENLSYHVIGDDASDEGILDKLVFRVQLTASLKNVSAEIPYYRIELKKGDGEVEKSVTKEKKSYTGKTIIYDAKMDHDIQGWDFDYDNENPGLYLETFSYVGVRVPMGALKWMNYQMTKEKLQKGNLSAELEYEGESQKEKMNEENAETGHSDKKPKKLKHPRINIDSPWGKTERQTWVKNVTVTNDGNETEDEMFFQVKGHKNIQASGIKPGVEHKGFIIAGGFSYPAGERIYHDPGVGSDVTLLGIAEEAAGSLEDDDDTPGFELLGVVAAVAAVVAVFSWKRK